MAARAKTAARVKARRRPVSRKTPGARTTAEMLRDTWSAAVTALSAAEEEAARQLRALLKRNRITAADAASAIAGLRVRVEAERRTLGRTFEDAVQGALASINVPSRDEVRELTRKVDELSRRLEASPARPRRAPRRGARKTSRSSSR